MGKSLNSIQLIGNVGKEPEIKYTNSGTAVAKFSIATNESYKDNNDELQDRTEWHNIVAWDKLAEIISKYVRKGEKIYVQGRVQTRSWDDKKSGEKKYMTEVVVKDLLLLGAKQAAAPEAVAPAGAGPISDDDIPF
jgi:single-strand DNA-binding protein